MGNPATVPVFHSGGGQGVPEAALAGHRRRVRARKRPHIVQVRFTDHACEVGTPEGIVHAEAGDAIVSGMFGEHWPVGRAFFDAKYQAVAPLAAGAPGSYLSLPIDVIATPMLAPFEVVLADGYSRLHGQAGDWLVDYGDGTLGIVNADIFKATYEILEEV